MKGTYQVVTGYSGSSCSGSPYYVSINQASSCQTTACSSGSDSSTSYTYSCINPPVTGTITSGYFIASANYGTDSSCSSTPSSVSVYPIGSCYTYSSSGGGSMMYTADNSGNIYALYYSSTSCSGTANSQSVLSKQSCGISSGSSSYSKGYFYSATLPTVGSGTTQTTYYYPTSTCTGSWYAASIYQTTSCSASTTCKSSSSGIGSTSTCTGATTGSITSGYAIISANYASTDTSCSSPTNFMVYPLNSCIQSYSSSNSGTATGGLKASADSNGNLYYSSYSSGTCSGTPISSAAFSPKSGCTCTSSSCSINFYYSATLPTVSGASQVTTVYSGSTTCSGTAQYIGGAQINTSNHQHTLTPSIVTVHAQHY